MNITLDLLDDLDGLGLAGVQRIRATATPPGGLQRIEVYLNGALYVSAGASPLAFQWDTTRVPDGTYKLSATAFYKTRKSQVGPLVVTVNNAAPAPTPVPTPTPPPGLVVPAQGITIPLGDLLAHGSDAIAKLTELFGGHKGFVRTDAFLGNPGWAGAKASCEAAGLVVMGIHNEKWSTRSTQATFAANAAAVAKQLTWVNVFNEPDNPWRDDGGAWDATVAGQYAGAAYAAIKAANPAAQVVGPSVSMSLGVDGVLAWLDKFFSAGGRCDWPSEHLYGARSDTSWPTNPWNRYPELAAMFVKHLGAGADKRIFLTECGNSATQHGDAYADLAVRDALDARAALGIPAAIVYSLFDSAEPGGFGIVGRAAWTSMQERVR